MASNNQLYCAQDTEQVMNPQLRTCTLYLAMRVLMMLSGAGSLLAISSSSKGRLISERSSRFDITFAMYVLGHFNYMLL